MLVETPLTSYPCKCCDARACCFISCMQYYEVSLHVVVIVLLCDPCSRSTAVALVIWDYILGMRVGILLSNSPYIAENFCKNMESPRLLVNVLMFNCVCINFGIGSSTRCVVEPTVSHNHGARFLFLKVYRAPPKLSHSSCLCSGGDAYSPFLAWRYTSSSFALPLSPFATTRQNLIHVLYFQKVRN